MRELHIFDFDSTLFRSPSKPDWWSGRHWYTSTDSLNLNNKERGALWIERVVEEARDSIQNPNVFAVLLTGREDTGGLRYLLAETLASKGLVFDKVLMRPIRETNVKEFKGKVCKRLVEQYLPERVKAWEDKGENLEQMELCCEVPFEGVLVF